MFSIAVNDEGIVVLTGRFDASQSDRAREVFAVLKESAVVDFRDLDYISSAGLGVLLATQQRLKKEGKAIKLVHMNRMVRDVFKIARFDLIFEIE
ncbi:MAG TPA: STAS domain-containing protein [Bacteroidota bacterium]|nr:STAS domain-containing protein [Bacteroidota bacterium]